jgi:asparagine synthase (glutamine-hydrolysing)
MCGIAGLWAPGIGAVEMEESLRSANTVLHHRGPDASGSWSDLSSGVGLAHTRLAIQDLTESGRQPMPSASGRYSLVFNGEIYNFTELHKDLAARYPFTGRSDTEVLIAAVETWGLDEALRRSHGMFAFALWDKQSQKLVLARDRMGEKPLYYGQQGREFVFASELAALKCLPGFSAQINRSALPLLLTMGNVATPHSIYEGIHKLEPGHYLTVSAKDYEFQLGKTVYWSYLDALAEGERNAYTVQQSELIVDDLEQQLRSVIARQMLADVPVGALLSGGIDSSTIVALMQQLSTRPVQTFSIGFHESAFDESKHAAAVAKHLGTDHHELIVSPQDALEVIPKLSSIYSEPFADWSQIPTYLVARMAREYVTVALSGDGGDELFAGYSRYQATLDAWRRPRMPRAMLAAGFHALSMGNSALARKLERRANSMHANNLYAFYCQNIAYWAEPVKAAFASARMPRFSDSVSSRDLDGLQLLMAYDSLQYLPDDILVKVDRAMMANSLEGRIPLLDHSIVELALRIPEQVYQLDGQVKWPLRQILYRYVPRQLIDREKMGFGVPMAQWLRGPLRDWAQALLEPRLLREQGFFDAAIIDSLWRQHLDEKADWSFQLWPVLMFQAWFSDQKKEKHHA